METTKDVAPVSNEAQQTEGPPRAIVYVTKSTKEGLVRLKFKLEGASLDTSDADYGVGSVIGLESSIVKMVETFRTTGIVYVTLRQDVVPTPEMAKRFAKTVSSAAGVFAGHTMVIDKIAYRAAARKR